MSSGVPRAPGSPGTRSPQSPSSAAGVDWARPPGSRLGPGRLRSWSQAWAATRATPVRSGSRTHGSHLSVVAVERPRDDGTGRAVGGGRALASGDSPRSARGFLAPCRLARAHRGRRREQGRGPGAGRALWSTAPAPALAGLHRDV